MKKQDKIKELFSEKLGNYSAPVNPELWNAIAAKVAVGSVASSSGLSLIMKGLIGLGAASVVGISSYFLFKSDSDQSNQIIKVLHADSLKNSKKEELTITTLLTQESDDLSDQNRVKRLITEKGVNDIQTVKTPSEFKEVEPIYIPKIALLINEEIVSKETIIEENLNDPLTENKTTREEKKEVLNETILSKNLEETADITLLPNSFTPNGDRINDEFYLEFNGELLDFNIVILDNKNQTVFESQDPYFKWSGLNKFGEVLPKGNYYYIVTARDSNNNPINKYNTLSIER